MLQRSRAFFAERGLLEVDCCALSPRAAIDANIDVINASVSDREDGFLHTSPEYAMKQLLVEGLGDIYYLGHVFRKNDIGNLHNPEFTMAEWYRHQMLLNTLMQETCDFLSLFLGSLSTRIVSYRDTLIQYAKVDASNASLEELQIEAKRYGAQPSQIWTRDMYVHFLLTHAVEPHLGKGEFTILTDYPPHEAALAHVIEKNGEKVAERFEIYHEGIELANGYHELSDAFELRQRFNQENEARQHVGKEVYLLDEAFLLSMQRGLPDCCGVSVGFDRVLMLRHKVKTIHEVLPFAWFNATSEQSAQGGLC